MATTNMDVILGVTLDQSKVKKIQDTLTKAFENAENKAQKTLVNNAQNSFDSIVKNLGHGKTNVLNYNKELENIYNQNKSMQESILNGSFKFDDFEKFYKYIISLGKEISTLEEIFQGINSNDIANLSKENLNEIRNIVRNTTDLYHKAVSDTKRSLTQSVQDNIAHKFEGLTNVYDGRMGNIAKSYGGEETYQKMMSVDSEKQRKQRGINNVELGDRYHQAVALYETIVAPLKEKNIIDKNGYIDYDQIAKGVNFEKASPTDKNYSLIVDEFQDVAKRVQRLQWLDKQIRTLEQTLGVTDKNAYTRAINFEGTYETSNAYGQDLEQKLKNRILTQAKNNYKDSMKNLPKIISDMSLKNLSSKHDEAQQRNIEFTVPKDERAVDKYLRDLDEVQSKIIEIQNTINTEGDESNTHAQDMLKYLARYKDLISDLSDEEQKLQNQSLFSKANGFDPQNMEKQKSSMQDIYDKSYNESFAFRKQINSIHKYKDDVFGEGQGYPTQRIPLKSIMPTNVGVQSGNINTNQIGNALGDNGVKVDEEVRSFVNLTDAIGDVTIAVETKNQGIKEEATLVDENVSKEIKKFEDLKTIISEIAHKNNQEIPINVKPNVDTQQFVDDIQKAIDGASVNINVDGRVSDLGSEKDSDLLIQPTPNKYASIEYKNGDLENLQQLNRANGIIKQVIVGLRQVSEFDFSKINPKDYEEFYSAYSNQMGLYDSHWLDDSFDPDHPNIDKKSITTISKKLSQEIKQAIEENILKDVGKNDLKTPEVNEWKKIISEELKNWQLEIFDPKIFRNNIFNKLKEKGTYSESLVDAFNVDSLDNVINNALTDFNVIRRSDVKSLYEQKALRNTLNNLGYDSNDLFKTYSIDEWKSLHPDFANTNNGKNIKSLNMKESVQNIQTDLDKHDFEVTVKPKSQELIDSINEVLKNQKFEVLFSPAIDDEGKEVLPSNIDSIIDSLATKLTAAIKEAFTSSDETIFSKFTEDLKKAISSAFNEKQVIKFDEEAITKSIHDAVDKALKNNKLQLKYNPRVTSDEKFKNIHSVEWMSDEDKTSMILEEENRVKKEIEKNKNFQLTSTKNIYRPDSKDLESTIISYIEKQADGAISQIKKKITVTPSVDYDEQGNILTNVYGDPKLTYKLKVQDTVTDKFKDINEYVDSLKKKWYAELRDYSKADSDIRFGGKNNQTNQDKKANALKQMESLESDISKIQSKEIDTSSILTKLAQERTDAEDQITNAVKQRANKEDASILITNYKQAASDYIKAQKDYSKNKTEVNKRNVGLAKTKFELAQTNLNGVTFTDKKQENQANRAKSVYQKSQTEIDNSNKVEESVDRLNQAYEKLYEIKTKLITDKDNQDLLSKEVESQKAITEATDNYNSVVKEGLISKEKQIEIDKKLKEIRDNYNQAVIDQQKLDIEAKQKAEQEELKKTEVILTNLINLYGKLYDIKTRALTTKSSTLESQEAKVQAEYNAQEEKYNARLNEGRVSQEQQENITSKKREIETEYAIKKENHDAQVNSKKANQITNDLNKAYKELYAAKTKVMQNLDDADAIKSLLEKSSVFKNALQKWNKASADNILSQDQINLIDNTRTSLREKFNKDKIEKANLDEAKASVDALTNAYDKLYEAKIKALNSPKDQSTLDALKEEQKAVDDTTKTYNDALNKGIVSKKQQEAVKNKKDTLDKSYDLAKAEKEKKDAEEVANAIKNAVVAQKELNKEKLNAVKNGRTNDAINAINDAKAKKNEANAVLYRWEKEGRLSNSDWDFYVSRIKQEKSSYKTSVNQENSKAAYKEIYDDIQRYKAFSKLIAQGADDSKNTLQNAANEIFDTITKRINELKNNLDLFNPKEDVKIQSELKKITVASDDISTRKTAAFNRGGTTQTTMGKQGTATVSAKYHTLEMQQERYLQLLQKRDAGTITAVESGRLRNFERDIAETLNKLSGVKQTLDEIDENGNQKSITMTERQNTELGKSKQILEDISKSKANKIIEDLEASSSRFTESGLEKLDELKLRLDNLKMPELEDLGNGVLGYKKGTLSTFNKEIDSIIHDLNILDKSKVDTHSNQDYVASMSANFYSQKSRNSKAVEARPEAFKSIEDKLSKAFDMTQSEAEKLDVRIKMLEADASKAGNTGASFLTEVGNRFKSLISYTASFVSAYQVIGQIRQGVEIVKQYDAAMTEMRKVTSGTQSQLEAYVNTTGKVADAIGTNAVTLQNSAADWMRLGYSIKDAGELAKNTATLMNVSEFDNIGEATESMVALVQAFKDANKDAGDLSADIIDKLNNIGNNYSISTSELAESLKRSSGTLIAAGNDIDKAIALTTAGNAIIQDPESVGNALKVISMRLRGTTAKELEDQGEDSTGLIETTSKLESQIKSLTAVNGKAGVSITDLNGNYRDTYEILQDIADIWDQIGEADKSDGQNRQAALLETMAGKTRAQALASILQNGDMLRSVYEDSQKSAGSAQHENETYMESIAAHQQQLQNAYQEMWSKAINRDVINFFLDLGKGTTNLISKVGLLKVALIGLAATLNGIFTKTGSGFFKVEYDNNGNAKSVFNKDNILSSIVRGYKDKPKTYGIVDEKEFNNANKESLAKLNKKNWEKDSDLQKMREYFHQVGANKGNYEEYKEYIKQANIDNQKFKLSTIGAKIATQAFGLAVSAVGTALASQAIGKIIKGLDDFIHREERVAEAAKEAKESFEDQKTSFKETKESTEEAIKSYTELMSGVDANGKNISLSTEDYSKFLEVNDTLAKLFPSLTRTYDENGNALVNLGNNAEEATKKLDALQQVQMKKAHDEMKESMSDIQKGALQDYKNISDDIVGTSELRNVSYNALNNYTNGTVTKNLLKVLGEDPNGTVFDTSFDEVANYKNALKALGWKENVDYEIAYGENFAEFSGGGHKSGSGISKDQVNSILANVYSEINDETSEINTKFKEQTEKKKVNQNSLASNLIDYFQTDSSYVMMNDESKALMQKAINNINYDQIAPNKTFDEMEKQITDNIINLFLNENNSEALQKLTTQQSGLMTGDSNLKEYKKQYDELLKTFEGTELKDTFVNMFGEDATPQLKNYNKLLEDIKQSFIDSGDQADIAEKEAQSMVDQLSNIGLATITTREDAGELFRTFAQGSDSVTEAWQKVYDYIKTTPEGIQAEIDKISSNAGGWSEGMNSFWTSINEQNSNGAVSTESYNSMISAMKSMGISAEDMFSIFHNGYAGLQLDTDKFWSLISKSSDEMVTSLDKQRSSLSNNLDRYQGELSLLEGLQDSVKEGLMSETDAINNYSRGVTNNTDLIGINKKSLDELVEAKRNDVETTRKQYAEIQNAIDKYDASYNAYNLLQSAISSANAGAHYDTVQGQKDQIEKLVKEHQWGTDDVEQWITYWTGQNGAELNHDQKVEAYKTANKNATTYSTENYKGVEAFYNKLTTLKKGVTYDANTDTLQINSIRDAANEANVSVSALVDILNKMKDYDIDVNFSETEANTTKAEDKVDDLQKKLDSLQYQRTLTIAANKDADTKELDSEIANLQQQLNNTKLEVTLFTNNDKVFEDLEKYKNIIKEYKKELDELNNGKGVKQGEDYVLDENGKVDFKNSKNKKAANIVNNMMNNTKLAKARGLKSGITEEAVSTLIKVDGVDEATGNLASVQDKFDETKKKVETPLVPTVNTNPLDASFARIQESWNRLRTYFKENPLPIFPAVSSYAANNDGSKSDSNGPSQAHGTARAQGTWGNNHPGKTLVGELGPELVVRGSEYFTVGDNGAEMVDLKKDDIVFNHEQTAGILNNRKINSRGEALAQGKNQELLVGNVDVANRPIVQLGDGSYANGQNNDLVGELGPELRIRGNEYTLLGQHGAEFADIRPDDIVLNAEQTANALSGKAYVHGKAYGDGELNTAAPNGVSVSGGKGILTGIHEEEVKNEKAKTDETKKQLKNEQAKTDAAKEEYFQEDRALDTVKKKNDKIRTAFEDTFKSYEEREQSFQELIINDQKVIETAMERLNRKQDTYNMRYTEAQKYFSDDQLEKIVFDIKNGNITPNNTDGASWDDYYDILYGPSDTKNEQTSKLYEKQKEAITNLMNAYDDQVSAEEDIVNAEKQMQQDRAAAYELDMSKIEEAIDEFQDKIDSIQTDIEIKGTTGKIVGAQDYIDLISASQDAQSAMEDKLARAEERLAELSPDSEEYWNVKKTISETTAAIKQADSQQAEWNETIKDLPITHLQTYIDNLNTIQKDLDNMTSEIEAKGQRVTEDLIKKQIDLQSMIAQQYKQQIDLVEDKLNNRGYTPGSDKWNETFQQLQDIDDSLANIVTQIIDFNKQLLQIPVDKLSDVNTEIQNIQSGLTSKQNDNTTVIQGYIAILQKANDDLTESYEDQIKPLQQQLDALNAQNEARQRQLNIEQAQYNLEKAREQKTVQVVRNGRLVYTADQDNVRNAENELAQANYDKMKGELQDKIDALEKDRDEKSEALTDAQNRWQKIQSDSETNINVSNAAELAKMSPEKLQQIALAEAEREKLKNQHLGEKGYDVNKDLSDAQKELLAEADKLYSQTKKDYESTAEQINSTDKIQSSLDTIVTLLTRINELYIKEAITAEEAKKMTQDVINSGKDGLTGLEHSNLVNEIEKKDSINDAINKAKDAISETTNGIDNLYKQTEANNVIINAYSKDKNALDAEIKKELEKSADAYANLKASEALGYTDKNAYGNGDYVGRGDSKGDTFTNGTDFAYSWFTEARASGLDTEKSKGGVDYYKNGTKVTRGSNGSLYIDTANGWATAISAAQIQKYGLDTARESNDAAANQKTASELLKESAGALNNAAGNIDSSSSKQDKILESHDGNYKNSGNGYTISQNSSGHKTVTINYGNGIVKEYGMAGGVIKRAGGIKEGAIPGFHGVDSNDARTKILQEMSMHNWKPSEIPIIADEGEVVLNKAQQNTMIQNMRSALTPVSLPNLDKNIPGASINISMGDLTLPNVTDGKSFATAIQQQFEPAMNQYFSKVFRK